MVWKWWPFAAEQNNNQASSVQNPQAQTQTKSYFRSYSSSRTCKPDPEDAAYMICKEKVNDGNNTYEKEQRVPVNQSITPVSFTNGMRGFDDVSSQFDKEFGVFPFFGPIFSPLFKDFVEFNHLNPEAHYHHHQQAQYGQPQNQQQKPQHARQQQQANSRYSFNGSGERDFSIRDL